VVRTSRPKTMTVEDAAKVLNIGRNQAYAAARAGELPVLRIGKRILVLAEPLNRLLSGDALPGKDAA